MADIFIDAEIPEDPDDLVMNALDYITSQKPGWDPADAEFEVILLGAIAQMIVVFASVAAVVPASIFRYLGATLVHVPPLDASAASVTSTWTMKDNAGYTIPDGTQVAISATGDTRIAFKTVGEVVVPPASTVTDAGEVLLVAINEGEDGSGLTGPATLIDSLDFVTDIDLVGETTGGLDAQEDDDYLNTLSQRLELMAPRPILARDAGIMARQTVGVWRALGLDGYKPSDNTFGNARYVAVAVVAEDGSNVSGGVKDAADADLQSERETNFVFNVIDPTRTTVDVTYEGVCLPGFDAAEVQGRVDDALAAYLNPALWGTPPGIGEAPGWVNTAVARLLKIAQVIEDVDGFDALTSLELGKNGGAQSAADVNLDGAAPLAVAGVIDGTVDQA